LAHSRKNQAEAEFKKTQRILDGKKAMSEYEAEAAAMRAKTEKLRALRLARDAADSAAAAAATAPANAGSKKTKSVKAKTVKAKPVKAKSVSAPLSDWLDDREGSGHNR
jgi:hypothetical protein